MAHHSFGVTWDYRCPFAAKAHDHVVTALQHGADWDVHFVPFSLGQVHVEEGQTPIWDRPGDDSGLLALQAGVVVRDRFPDQFLAAHRALFDARHLHAQHLRDEAVIREALASVGVDDGAVFDEIAGGSPLKTIQTEHEAAAAEHHVWGVPTFIAEDQAAFIRLMTSSNGNGADSQRCIERLLGLLVRWPEVNEFKHTSIPR